MAVEMAREFSVPSQIGLTALLVATYLSIVAIGGLRKLYLIFPLVAVHRLIPNALGKISKAIQTDPLLTDETNFVRAALSIEGHYAPVPACALMAV